MLASAALAFLAVAGFTGSASAQPSPYDLEMCVGAPSWEAFRPSSSYFTHGPGAFGRDTTSPAPPYSVQGALTIVGGSSGTLSRWLTKTTAIGDGCAGYGLPPVHGGGYVEVWVWMRTLNVPGYATVTLTYWDKNVQYIGSTSGGRLTGTTDWTPTGVDAVIPDGTTYIRIEYRLSGPGKLWIGGSTGGFSYATLTYPYPPAVNLTPPSVAGLAQVGQLLTANPGTWEGDPSGGFSFLWYRCDGAGQSCVLIPDAGGYFVPNGPDPPGQYTVRPDDVGSTIRVAVKLIAEQPADFVMSAPTAVVTSPGGQLAPDPGFEVDPVTFYYGHGPGTFSWAMDAAHGGTHALKIVSTSSELSRWLTQMRAIPVTPGQTYDVSAWLRTTGTAAKGRLSVNFWTAGGVYIPATVDTPTLSGTHDWTQQTLHLTAPPGAANLRVEFRLNGPGTLWADDLSLTH
jgi:hypothetical protein